MNLKKLVDDLSRLHSVTNKMADEVYTIHAKMEGRGVNPAEAPLVISKLREIEQKLRMLGANKEDLIPF